MVTTHFMDESEHCDKVAFIYFGGLIAIDTPENLKQMIPGSLYEIDAQDGMQVLAQIQNGAIGEVMDAYFHGEKCRVLVSEERDITKEKFFENLDVKKIAPSMEDVFAYMVKAQSNKEMTDGRISGTGSTKLKIRTDKSKEA